MHNNLSNFKNYYCNICCDYFPSLPTSKGYLNGELDCRNNCKLIQIMNERHTKEVKLKFSYDNDAIPDNIPSNLPSLVNFSFLLFIIF